MKLHLTSMNFHRFCNYSLNLKTLNLVYWILKSLQCHIYHYDLWLNQTANEWNNIYIPIKFIKLQRSSTVADWCDSSLLVWYQLGEEYSWFKDHFNRWFVKNFTCLCEVLHGVWMLVGLVFVHMLLTSFNDALLCKENFFCYKQWSNCKEATNIKAYPKGQNWDSI